MLFWVVLLVLQEQEQTVFQRLREWDPDAGQKSGTKRRELEVSTCFAPLLGWVLRLWRSEKRQLPLVMDATSLGNRWTILAISVVLEWVRDPGGLESAPSRIAHSRGVCIGKDCWAELGKAVPPEWEVLVLADRGLYARWLWDAIVVWGWHPSHGSMWGPKPACRERKTLHGSRSCRAPTPGTSWQGKVECFASKKGRVNGTLLMHWEPGYESAWIILTDLEPEEAW